MSINLLFYAKNEDENTAFEKQKNHENALKMSLGFDYPKRNNTTQPLQ
jgi:hypothetical protein